ncbi:MAG TPA: nucleotidyltransferase family protein [Rhizorhapis sp.]|nr:nucleotidyltransferase family protein [Rhizorhapis sp.]
MALCPQQTACLLLAAGRSERFGAEDKLLAPFEGRPLLHHALLMLDSFAFGRKILVCRAPIPALPATEFEVVLTDRPSAPLSYSIRTGLQALASEGFSAVLIALADMPNVPAAHIQALLHRFDSGHPDCVIASQAGGSRSPPALFATALLPRLMQLEGDKGARDLLSKGEAVQTPPGILLDIDSPEDLRRHRPS